MKDVRDFESWDYTQIPLGGVSIEAGNSDDYETGGWRSIRPVWDKDNCTNCMLCWVSCPDSSILVKDQEMTGIDYQHCKGCGICAEECRFEALKMIPENEAEAK